MKSALQLLVTAPDNEIIRMKLVYTAIVQGNWPEAVFHLSNITTTENSSRDEVQWVKEAHELCDFCNQANQVTNKSL